MATSENLSEENCCCVFWKIKNFSYSCGTIRSPVFKNYGNYQQYAIELGSKLSEIECKIRNIKGSSYNFVQSEVSFLTCDGSPDEFISGEKDVCLKVEKDVIFGNRRSSLLPEDTLTVRVRIPNDEGKFFFSSQIGVKRNYFLWNIPSFSTITYPREKEIENSACYGKINLTLKPKGGINSTDQINLDISRTGGKDCYCVLRVSMLDVDGKSMKETCDTFSLRKTMDQQVINFPLIFKRSKLPACANLVLKEDKLSLKCFFAITLGTVSDETADISYSETDTSLLKDCDHLSMVFQEKKDLGLDSELRTDLKNILQDETLCDTQIQIGNEVINVHKSILSARSPVFKAMFTKDMKEKNDNTVVIEDLDLDTMRRLLLYMYTGTIQHGLWGNTKELYIAANKYEMLSLKKKCASFLKSNLSVSNVSEALVLADLHEDEDLKAIVHDYISENDSVVFHSEKWKELGRNNSSLVIQSISEICCNKRFRFS